MKLLDCEYNPEVVEILNSIQQQVFAELENIVCEGNPDEDYHTGQDYLEKMLEKDSQGNHKGFPEVTHGCSITNRELVGFTEDNEIKHNITEEFYESNVQAMSKLCTYLGARNNAVMMYYPKNGFMGWHHNANAPGYNILMSYSTDGDGYFRYRDPVTKEVVTMPDKKGWTIKVGYYGGWGEDDKIYWHCARTKNPRITLGFIIPDENMWQMMIDDICDYDQ